MVETLEKAKNSIRQELDGVLKVAAQQFRDDDRLSDDVNQAICNVVEAVFIHGLKDAFFLKGSRFSKYPEPNFWPFVSKFTHRAIKTQIGELKQIKSEIGKARAWIRIVLNEGQLEHYINLLSKDTKQLSNFYLKNAFLRDGERLEALLGYLTALTKLPLNAPINSSFLNTWTPSPLILAGLISGKPQRVVHLANSKRRNASSNSLLDEPADEAINALDLLDESGIDDPTSPKRTQFEVDDDNSSVYSHPSMIQSPGLGVPINFKPTYSPFLSSTPENRPLDQMLPEEEAPLEVVVNRRRTTRVRKASRSSGSDDSRRGSLTQMSLPENSPMSSSLPSGTGLLSVKEMHRIMTKEKSAPNFGEFEKSRSSSIDSTDEHDELPLQENDPFDDPIEQSEPQTIFGDFDQCESNTEQYGVSLHDQFMQVRQQSSSSSVLPDSTPSSCPSSVGNSLVTKGWSIPSRRESCTGDSVVSSTDSTDNGITLDAALKGVLKNSDLMMDELSRDLSVTSLGTPTDGDTQTLLAEPVSMEDVITLTKSSELATAPLKVIPDDVHEPVVIEDENLLETDEYGISRHLLTTFTELPQEKGLCDQDYRCPSCRMSIGGAFRKFFLCSLDGRYYCGDCWRRGDDSIIPARVVLNWDCKRRPISKASKAFLKTNADRPLIRIDQVNPLLYAHSKQMTKILKLRERLSLVVVYLLSCKQSVAEDLKRRVWPQDYFYTDVHLYSVTDLQNVISGVFERRLNTIIKFAISHIEGCSLCLQKGFVCEICSGKKIIYPFQVDIADRCKECGSVYHIKCFKGVECPKCRRQAKYTARRADELPLE